VVKVVGKKWPGRGGAADPRREPANMSKSKVKPVLIVFLDAEGVVRKELVPRGRTVNSTYYVEVLLGQIKKKGRPLSTRYHHRYLATTSRQRPHQPHRSARVLTKHSLATSPTPVSFYSPDLSRICFVTEHQGHPETYTTYC